MNETNGASIRNIAEVLWHAHPDDLEAQSLRSRGDAYRRYQETTSAFVPWPPRKSGRASGD